MVYPIFMVVYFMVIYQVAGPLPGYLSTSPKAVQCCKPLPLIDRT